MKVITEDDFNTTISNFDLSQLEEKEMYLNLSTLYRFLINKYFDKVIKKYDDMIFSSNLNFSPVKDNEKDFYQYYTNNNLKYYYIRNNIYLNALSESEINYLNNKWNNNDFEFTEEDSKFIENTFNKVIKEDYGIDEPFDIAYGPDTSYYNKLNNSLVIGFRYDAFNDSHNDDLYDKQQYLCTNVNNKLEKKLNSLTNIPVSVLEYNKYSVDKLKKERVL